MGFLSKVIEGFKATPPPAREENISPELMQKIQAIQIKTSHMVTELMAGEYVSAFKGRGMEFNAVREYTGGRRKAHRLECHGTNEPTFHKRIYRGAGTQYHANGRR